MAVKIGSNIPSLQAQRRLLETSSLLSKTFERLSSGQRINRASDDAAGLAISSVLNAGVRVNSQAVRNVNDGISLSSIAENALAALREITLRQKELAAQAANGSYTLVQRQAMNAEANTLVDEYNRIVKSTEFNGTKLFGDDPENIRIQAGIGLDGSLLLGIGAQLSRATGNGTFIDSGLTWVDGSGTESMVTADFNNDGIPDIATADPGAATDTASIMLGDGAGNLISMGTMGTGSHPDIVVAGDFNGDGNADIAVATDMGIEFFMGAGDGTFSAGATININATAMATGDFNGDGKDDMLASDGTKVYSYLRNASGGFTLSATITSGGVIAAADINGDNKLDLITTGYSGTNLSVFSGNGSGGFSLLNSTAEGFAPTWIVSGDFNRDGRTDIAVSGSNKIVTYLGNGTGSFAASSTVSAAGVSHIKTADLTGDGNLDLLAVLTVVGVALLRGDGQGAFSSSTAYTNAGLNDVVAADFNSDGVVDFVANESDILNIELADTAESASTPYLNLNTRQGALAAVSVIDANLQRIENELASIGAAASRFSAALSALQATVENEAAAAARITDADIAQESAGLASAQIRQQAAAAVLAHANMQPALAVTLLK